jgi:hypothetical protein
MLNTKIKTASQTSTQESIKISISNFHISWRFLGWSSVYLHYLNVPSFQQLVEKVQEKPHREGTNKIFIRAFYTFRPIWIKLGTRDLSNNLLSHCQFRANRYSDSHILLDGGGGGG